MLLAPIPWAERLWALPFLTSLTPSERYDKTQRYRHKTLTDWGRQMLLQVLRWLPTRAVVVVADSSFAVITLLKRMQELARSITMVTRFRLDAALYEPVPARQPGQKGRPRLKGKRLPTLEQVAHDPATTWTHVTLHLRQLAPRATCKERYTRFWSGTQKPHVICSNRTDLDKV